MYEHAIRFQVLVPVAALLGLAALFAEVCGLAPGFPGRPDWFWCLAVFAAIKAPPKQAILAFACCGLARDLLLGPKPGSAMFAFVLIGWFSLYWKPLAADRGWPGQVLFAALGALGIALIKHTLDYGLLAYKLWYWILAVSLSDAALTLPAYPPLAVLLAIPSFRPWREGSVFLN